MDPKWAARIVNVPGGPHLSFKGTIRRRTGASRSREAPSATRRVLKRVGCTAGKENCGQKTRRSAQGTIGVVQSTVTTSVERLERRRGTLTEHRALGGPVRLYFRYREQVLYLVVGGWNTVFGYAVWALLYFLLRHQLHYLIILVLSWPFAVANAYICYRTIVFRSTANIWRELPRFSLVYVVTLVSALIALPILVNTLPFNLYVIQALYTGVVVVLSYLGHKYFSFRKTHRRSATPQDEESIA